MPGDEQVVQLLQEILLWLKFQNREDLKNQLKGVLATRADRKVYELTDGARSQPDIARAADVSQPTVSNKWKAWRTIGIVYEVPGGSGRCSHLASLSSLGIEVS